MEFPNLGEHCSEETCHRLDFLPLKCDACESVFCSNHISYLGHSCPSAYKKDVQVPTCPICNTPIPLKRGESPDLAVGLHMDNNCKPTSTSEHNKKKVFVNKCSSKGCKIREVVRVDCKECGLNFCLKHRHPVDHNCSGHNDLVKSKRLEKFNKLGNSSQRNNINGTNSFNNLQGSMSEDEALARALQASMLDEQVKKVPSENRDRCNLS